MLLLYYYILLVELSYYIDQNIANHNRTDCILCEKIAVLAPSTMRAILGNGASVQVF